MSPRFRISALRGLQVAGPEASGHLESNVVTRSIVGLVAGAVLGAVLGAIFGVVLYVIFGWLLSGVTTFLGLNIFQTLAGLYVGSIIGTLVGAIVGLIFVGSVNIAEESPFYSVLGAFFAWLTYARFSSFSNGVESAITGASIGVTVGLIAGFASGLISKGSLDKVFRVSSAGAGSAVGAAVFGVFILPHVASTTDTTIGIVIGLFIGVAAGFGTIVTSRRKSSSKA
ncbi:MAG: hypothetical protein ACXVI0_12110 [Halobacteriota archaeon]